MVLKMWVRDGHVCSVEEVLYPFVHLCLFVCILFVCLFRCLFDLGEGRPMAMSVPLKRLCISLFIFTTFYVLFVSCFANAFLDLLIFSCSIPLGSKVGGYIWRFFYH